MFKKCDLDQVDVKNFHCNKMTTVSKHYYMAAKNLSHILFNPGCT